MREPAGIPKIIRGLMLVLGVLVIADAHIVTAIAQGRAVVEPTCGTGAPVLQRGTESIAIGSMESWPSPSSHIDPTVLDAKRCMASILEVLSVPTGNPHQHKLHAFVHVFRF